jgi:hypothetical protein
VATVNLKDARKANSSAVSREQKFKDRYNMYQGNYRYQAKARLEDIYDKAALIGMDKQLDMTNNVFRSIIDKTSKVYTNGVVREINDQTVADYYDDLRIDQFMTQANKYLNALNDLVVQVVWDEANNRPKMIFRYPHKTRVELDEFGDPKSVEYFVENLEKGKTKWAYWSETEHYYREYATDGSYEKDSLNDDDVNPFGFLPFIFMQKGFRDGTFFDEHSGTDLVETTLDNSIYNTFKNYLIKWQSFKQIVVVGQNVGEIDGQMLDPSSAITVSGTDVNFQLLDLQANLDELAGVLDASISKIAINYNISPAQFKMTSQVSTGFALKMENQSLDNITRENQKDFVLYERELNALITKIGNMYGNNFQDGFIIAFNPIAYQERDEEKLNAYTRSVDLGLTNPIEIISKDKNIPLDKAKGIWEENIKIRNDMLNKLGSIEIKTDIED